jgi:hypothetical protein
LVISRGLHEAACLVDPELGLAARACAGDLELIERVARQPVLAHAPGRERPGRGELADLRVDGDLAAAPRQEPAREPGRQQGQVAIALGNAEQPVQPVARGRHGPRPPSLRADVVEVGVDGDADGAIVGLIAERVDVCLGSLSRREAAGPALASRACVRVPSAATITSRQQLPCLKGP